MVKNSASEIPATIIFRESPESTCQILFLVQRLANHAITNTEHQAIRAEACYQLGRCYHKQHDFEQAFKFYYQGNIIS